MIEANNSDIAAVWLNIGYVLSCSKGFMMILDNLLNHNNITTTAF